MVAITSFLATTMMVTVKLQNKNGKQKWIPSLSLKTKIKMDPYQKTNGAKARKSENALKVNAPKARVSVVADNALFTRKRIAKTAPKNALSAKVASVRVVSASLRKAN